MSDTITITGLVATQPRHIVTSEGLAITTFRLVSTQRRFDRASQKWIDGDSNWFTIASFRSLAAHVSASVNKGERVLVTGRLRIREWENEEKTGTNVEIEADAIGHDLLWGTSTYSRAVSTAAVSAAVSATESQEQPDASAADSAAAEDSADSVDGVSWNGGDAASESGDSSEKAEALVGLPF
jgi:single-strand DNA-binding protein